MRKLVILSLLLLQGCSTHTWVYKNNEEIYHVKMRGQQEVKIKEGDFSFEGNTKFDLLKEIVSLNLLRNK